MPSPRGILILAAICSVLLAEVVFIFWATEQKFLIAIPAAIVSLYLAYAAAYWTIPLLKKWVDDHT